MIETSLARSKDPILKIHGKHLASSVDPKREAEAWTKNLKVLPHIRQLIVLGVGCGYHLSALEQKFSGVRILGIEFLPEAIDFVQRHQSLNLIRTDALLLHNSDELFDSVKVRQAVGEPYTVFIHNTTEIYSQPEFKAVAELLLGRTLRSFKWLCDCRGLGSLFFDGKLLSTNTDNSLLSIKEINSFMNGDGPFPQEIAAIKALRELIL